MNMWVSQRTPQKLEKKIILYHFSACKHMELWKLTLCDVTKSTDTSHRISTPTPASCRLRPLRPARFRAAAPSKALGFSGKLSVVNRGLNAISLEVNQKLEV